VTIEPSDDALGSAPTREGGMTTVTGPPLTIVIVSATGARDLLSVALQSLRDHPYTLGSQMVHVVDNASTDGTADMVRDEFPEVTLHALDWNAGFCVANNLVLRVLQTPYVLVLNPDTAIYPGSLDHMVNLLEEDHDVGIAGCRLERPDGTFDHAAKRSFPTPSSSLSHFLGLGRRLGGRFASYQAVELGERETGLVDAVNGAYMLVRKAAMDEVGLLDEQYWMYMEDLDWCFRFKRAGWKVVYDGQVSSMHVKGGTTKNKAHRGLRTNVAFHRGMGRFYRKFYAGEHPTFDTLIYAAVLGKLAISVTRSAIARRSIT
jgi:GT2 family glycosyltransferase